MPTPYEEQTRDIFDELLRQISIRGDLGKAITFRQWLKDQQAAFALGDKQARNLVDAFYTTQENRKHYANQERALRGNNEPYAVVEWLLEQNKLIEPFVAAALAIYVQRHEVGPWLTNIYGIGPIISAGLLAHIDIEKCPTVGHIWQYSGIAGDSQHKWERGQKRPFNAFMKTLCFKIGDCFIKFSNRDECYYGQIYRDRKAYEIRNNDSGRLVEQALREVDKKGKTTTAWPWNAGCYHAGACAAIMEMKDEKQRVDYLKSTRVSPGSGLPMLHPGHINDRARRYAVKQFLADFHGEWYRRHFKKEPPLPYPIEHLGHVHLRKVG